MLMSFVFRHGSAETRPCTVHFETRPCYRCFSCDCWFCEGCDLVHSCDGCGGTFCFECRPCALCEIMLAEHNELRDHPCSVRCECGSFLDLAGGGCEECYHLCCLADSSECAREIVTNSCCRKDKCWHCSWWHLSAPSGSGNILHHWDYASRICRTCPVPSNAVLQIQGFPQWS